VVSYSQSIDAHVTASFIFFLSVALFAYVDFSWPFVVVVANSGFGTTTNCKC